MIAVFFEGDLVGLLEEFQDFFIFYFLDKVHILIPMINDCETIKSCNRSFFINVLKLKIHKFKLSIKLKIHTPIKHKVKDLYLPTEHYRLWDHW